MRRRELLSLGTASALAFSAAPLGARAQGPRRMARIAIWSGAAPLADMREDSDRPYWRAFLRELRVLGLVEGRNLAVERYTAEGRPERYDEIAARIAASRPDVIVPVGETLVRPMLARSTAIPIVVPTFSDPVVYGFVPSLARPGGNLTGFTNDGGVELGGLRLQLLKEAVPRARRLACLATVGTFFDSMAAVLDRAAAQLGVSLRLHTMTGPFDAPAYGAAFAELAADGVEGVYLTISTEHLVNRGAIIALTAAGRLPALYAQRDFVDDGGLICYGANLVENYRKAAGYVLRVLNGEKPGDLPVQQPTRFDCIVNLKTARALGIQLPESIMIRATEVIE
jgi:putative tryptophan/tyrosine transport system substrate-binding protein